MGAIGTQLRDLMKSRLTRWRLICLNGRRCDKREERENPRVSTKSSLGVESERAGGGRDGNPCLERVNCRHFLSSADHEQDWQPYPIDS